ncbi:MAG: VCBS repeat-containing protein [Chloroflexi bacterium]|nr:VCBS repeat-containing protein [Chloroflexota bacterium]
MAWQNDGTPFAGGWLSNTVGSHTDYVRSVAIGDLDGDGQPDVASSGDDYQVMAWQNDGAPFAGGWLSNTVGTLGDYVRTVAIGDLDGDGQPDVVSGDDDYQVVAWQCAFRRGMALQHRRHSR